MDPATASETFYDRVPVFRGFPRLMDETLYRPLPQDWVIGSADVVASTRAIRENRYKAVNMAGAAVIASVANALGREFPVRVRRRRRELCGAAAMGRCRA